MDFTIDELLVVCISRQIVDGEALAQGLATPLVSAGYALAKMTHAPNVLIGSAISGGFGRDCLPLGLAYMEGVWMRQIMAQGTFAQLACDVLPRFHMKEFFRPAQVDPNGNFNNVVVGDDYDHPQMRLPGCGGIADVTVYSDKAYLYVPRHSRAVFVERVDFVSGLGHHPARRTGAGPRYLLTNLGQFDFAQGRMRLTHIHPSQTIEHILAKTGFPLEIAPSVGETEPPSVEELHLLREVIDPLGTRRLETLSGAARRTVLREILAAERDLHAQGRI